MAATTDFGSFVGPTLASAPLSRPNSGVTLHPGNILVSPQLAEGTRGTSWNTGARVPRDAPLTKRDREGRGSGNLPSFWPRSAQPIHGGPRWLLSAERGRPGPTPCPVLVGFTLCFCFSPPFPLSHHLGLGLQLPQSWNLSAWPCCVLKPSTVRILFSILYSWGLEFGHVSRAALVRLVPLLEEYLFSHHSSSRHRSDTATFTKPCLLGSFPLCPAYIELALGLPAQEFASKTCLKTGHVHGTASVR